MKLLLDEHLAKVVAEQLRSKGFDVVALTETERRSIEDEDLLALAHSLTQVLVTYNKKHFSQLHHEWLSVGRHHSGIIGLDSKKLPSNDYGAQIRLLEEILMIGETDECLPDQFIYLP
jgi:hypothetical protein